VNTVHQQLARSLSNVSKLIEHRSASNTKIKVQTKYFVIIVVLCQNV